MPKLPDNNISLIMRLMCACWVITKLICFSLWTGTRDFPLVPLFEFLNAIPGTVHLAVLVISLLLMAGFIFKPSKRLIIAILIIELISCLLDQNRWQPWQYQFMLMSLAYILLDDAVKLRAGWMIILSGIYFFSGFSKLSPDFIHDTWQWLILNQWLGIRSPGAFLVKCGYFLPLVEVATGILLWVKPLRKYAFIVIVLIHVFNLILLGPAGLNINTVIWPWNIFMPVCIYLLLKDIQFRPVFKSHWAFILICWCLPFLMKFGLWDRYLSFTLYSGGVPQLMICSEEADAIKYSGGENRANSRIPCNAKLLAAWDWGMNIMNTAPYPELRVYRKIAEEWRRRYPNSKHSFFIVRSGFQYRVNLLK